MEDLPMKTGTALVATLFALTSLSLLGQQSPPDSQPSTPATQQNSPPGTQPEQPVPDNQPSTPAEKPNSSPTERPSPASPASSPETATAAVEMRPVHTQLVSKLDTQTAKTGDDVVVETKAAVKTADGTEIPKGSKLMGHVVAVQPSTGGTNSQVALQFDQAELKGGKNLPIHSEIQSIEPPGGETAASQPSGMDRGVPSGPTAGMASATSPSGSASGSAPNTGTPGAMPEGSGMGNAAPAAGTVVGKTGNITIKTTSVPGVLLANNSSGQQDPRLAQASGILLGSKKDVKLEGGTEMTLAVATVPGGGAQ
jgi:hypothetical protein